MGQLYIKREEQTLEKATNLGRVKSSVFMDQGRIFQLHSFLTLLRILTQSCFHSSGKDPNTWKHKVVF